MIKFILTSLGFIAALTGMAQANARIMAGPMLGYVEMREAAIWVQTNGNHSVGAVYWEELNPAKRYRTAQVQAEPGCAWAVELTADTLMPGRQYRYQIELNGRLQEPTYNQTFTTPKNWRIEGVAPELTLAVGSCHHANDSLFDKQGKPYGGGFEIFDAIASKQPDAMIWLGDNVYYRAADWTSRTGLLYRNSHSRSQAYLQRLLAACPHYAIWDDHDFGPNDANGSYPLKQDAFEVFNCFWANPSHSATGQTNLSTAFELNGVPVFLLDNRSHRTEKLNSNEKHILGRKQIDWLINGLKYANKAPFKLVCVGGQVLNEAAVFENHAQYPEETAYLLKRLEEEQITGVVFVSGDRHHSAINTVKLGNGIEVIDITSSPLTSGAHTPKEGDSNSRVIAESVIDERNFAILHIEQGKELNTLTATYFSSTGQELYRKVFEAQTQKNMGW